VQARYKYGPIQEFVNSHHPTDARKAALCEAIQTVEVLGAIAIVCRSIRHIISIGAYCRKLATVAAERPTNQKRQQAKTTVPYLRNEHEETVPAGGECERNARRNLKARPETSSERDLDEILPQDPLIFSLISQM